MICRYKNALYHSFLEESPKIEALGDVEIAIDMECSSNSTNTSWKDAASVSVARN